MKNKRLISLICALVMIVSVLGGSAVFAADVDTPVHDDPVEPIVGSCITSGAATCSNGYCEFNVYLSSGNWDAYIMAGVASSSASGVVHCYVTLPNGTTQSLGSVSASGGTTSYIYFLHLSAVTYKFIFDASTGKSLEVFGRIYD